MTDAELTTVERKAPGHLVRLVRYARELRALLLEIQAEVRALPPELHARLDSEAAAIMMEMEERSH